MIDAKGKIYPHFVNKKVDRTEFECYIVLQQNERENI